MAFFDFFQNILPTSFLSSPFKNVSGWYKVVARQFDDAKAAVLDAQNQLFIDSATWALPIYEAEFAIKLVDQSNTTARQNNVMAMSRGGLGATPSAITNVLQAYGYTTQIIESFGTYTFTIKFTDFKGVPSNLNDLQEILNRMVPGHLKVVWQYLYNVYSDLNGKYTYDHIKTSGKTYQQLQTQLPT